MKKGKTRVSKSTALEIPDEKLLRVESVQMFALKVPVHQTIDFIPAELDVKRDALKVDRLLREILPKKTYDYIVRYHAKLLAEDMRRTREELEKIRREEPDEDEIWD